MSLVGCVCSLLLSVVGAALAANTVEMPVYRSMVPIYYVYLSVGTPPVQFTMGLDTGSSDLLVPDVACADECLGDDRYNSSASATSAPIYCNDPSYACTDCLTDSSLCGYTVSYVGVAEKATLWNDVISIPNTDNSLIGQFGAVYSVIMGDDTQEKRKEMKRPPLNLETPFQPEGMWGMGFQTESASNAIPLFNQFYLNGIIDQLIFSMCITSNGGMLYLGGVGPYSNGPISYTPIISQDFFTVHINDITVGGVSIGVAEPVINNPCIVDTGTTWPTMPQAALDGIENVMLDNCSNANLVGICSGLKNNLTLFDGACYKLTAQQIAMYPVISFLLDGVTLNYPPQLYITDMYYCSRGELGLALGLDTFTVMGAQLLTQYNVIYDMANLQVGFADLTSCS
ncbi:Eukaryotic aspartyl protease [Pelomyxa schiedti]|nr:Eukaryotic aspartyl protease [Pelomyxa schiedti]